MKNDEVNYYKKEKKKRTEKAVDNNFLERLKKLAEEDGVVVTDEEIYHIETNEEKKQKAIQTKKDYIDGQIKSSIGKHFLNCTMENYREVNPYLKICKNTVKKYIEDIKKTVKDGLNIVMYGIRGTGKTHLAKVIFEEALWNDVDVEYFTAKEMMLILRSGNTSGAKLSSARDIFITPELLILEEVGKTMGDVSEFEMTNIIDILDNRYKRERSTILISNIVKYEELAHYISDDCISRFNDSKKTMKLVFKGEDQRK